MEHDMSNALEVNQSNFESEVLEASANMPVLIDFWAPWCGPCRQLMPILDRVAADHVGKVKLVKINTDDENALAGAFGIRSLPTVVLMKSGQVVDGFMGAQPESVVRALLAKHLSGDDEAVVEDEVAEPLALADEERIAAFEAQLAAEPDKEEHRAELADAYARVGRIDEAQAMLAALSVLADGEIARRATARIRLIGMLQDALPAVELEQAIARDGQDLTARHQLGLRFLLAGQERAGLDQFIVMLKTDRKFGEDLARRTLLDAFLILTDEELVGEYRRKVTSLLF
jgi:putative thioredoxin